MDQLGGATADAMAAEQPSIVAMEEHLKKTGIIAQNWPPRNLFIPRDPRLIGGFGAGQFLLGGPHHGNLGNRIDSHWIMCAYWFRLHPEHVASREPSLFARGGG